MMRRKTYYYLALFITMAFIHQTLSAIFMSIRRTHPQDDYIKSRTASVHRGLLLSYSPATKNEICLDLFSSKLPATSKPETPVGHIGATPTVTDGQKSVGQPQHTLLVRRISTAGKTSINKDDIFFDCRVENLPSQEVKEDITLEYIVSSAFRLGLMYASFQKAERDKYHMIVKHYIGISPKYVKLGHAELEEQYVTIRRVLRALAQEESAEYIHLVEKMDNLSKLSNWQKLLLCNSVISSPVYHKEGLKFPSHWSFQNKDTLQYTKISVSFENPNYDEDWTAPCVPCKAIDEGNGRTTTNMKDLFLVQTFDDKKSIYVFEQENGRIYARKYFKDVPILANANDPVTDDPLF